MQAALPDVAGAGQWQQQQQQHQQLGVGLRGGSSYGQYTRQQQQPAPLLPGGSGLGPAFSPPMSLLPPAASWGSSSASQGRYTTRDPLAGLASQQQPQHPPTPLLQAASAGLSSVMLPAPAQLYMPTAVGGAAGSMGVPGLGMGGSYAAGAPGMLLGQQQLMQAGGLSLGGAVAMTPSATGHLVPSLTATPFAAAPHSSWIQTAAGLQQLGAGSLGGSLLMPGGASGLMPSPAAAAQPGLWPQAGLGAGSSAGGAGGSLVETMVFVQPQVAALLASGPGMRFLQSLQPALGVTSLLTDQVDALSGMRKVCLGLGHPRAGIP
jgi:hypothetical protein